MKIGSSKRPSRGDRSAVLVLLSCSGSLRDPDWPEGIRRALQGALGSGDFTGESMQTALIYDGNRRILLIGLGAKDKVDVDLLRRAGGLASGRARALKQTRLTVWTRPFKNVGARDHAQALVEGLILGNYVFHGLKSEAAPAVVERVEIVCDQAGSKSWSHGLRVGEIVAEAQCAARDLGNQPANVVTPQYLAATATRIAARGDLHCRILQGGELVRRKFGGLMAVSQGSKDAPVLIEMDYRPRRARKTVCLIGKGLTFDSGGISLKPAEKMEEMKYDMCGGAAVLCALDAVHRLRPAVRVIGLVPATTNMPGGGAIKPGDVIKSYGGIRIEVINTEAEGRLVLADALGRARELNPDYTIDLATLTGAVVVALGHRAAGLFSTSDTLADRLLRASNATRERLWRLPLWDEYLEDLKSQVADLKNSGSRWGGALTAAAFLKKFAGDLAFAHLDIAGTAWDMPRSEYYDHGATGFGVRTLVRFIEELD